MGYGLEGIWRRVFPFRVRLSVARRRLQYPYKNCRLRNATGRYSTPACRLSVPRYPLLRRRIFFETIRWPDGTRLEIAATIGTDASEHIINAAPAKRTLECADHRIRRVDCKITITVFAVWANFEHNRQAFRRGRPPTYCRAPEMHRIQCSCGFPGSHRK